MIFFLLIRVGSVVSQHLVGLGSQVGHSMRRHRRNDPIVQWALQVEERRGRAIAVVALARKMATILYAMWRDGAAYNPTRAAAPMLPTEATAP